MLGFSICSLLMRSFISLATSTLSLEVTSLTCKSERRLGTAPGPISGQSRPAVWPRAGRQPRTPLKRNMNAIRFHRGDDAEMVSGSRTAGASIREPEEFLLVDRVQQRDHRPLDNLVLQSRHIPVELHSWP